LLVFFFYVVCMVVLALVLGFLFFFFVFCPVDDILEIFLFFCYHTEDGP